MMTDTEQQLLAHSQRFEALLNEELAVLRDHGVDAVVHCAAKKAVGESVEKPLEYYDNNVRGTLELLAAMRRADVWTIVFSSSATVYV